MPVARARYLGTTYAPSSVRRFNGHGLLGRRLVGLAPTRAGCGSTATATCASPPPTCAGSRSPPPRRQGGLRRQGPGGRLAARPALRSGFALDEDSALAWAARLRLLVPWMNRAREALLVLEDGIAFAGEAFTAAPATVAGEVVFNTAMCGYQEVLTDPSYAGQLVCMAAPEVGNYGTVPADAESERVQVAAFLVRQAARRPSSWRAERSLAEELDAAGARVEGLDTRRLVRHLAPARGHARRPLQRDHRPEELRELALAAPDPNGLAMVDRATRAEPAELPADGDERLRVVLYDSGAKANIARRLRRLGAWCWPCRRPPRPPTRRPGGPTG